MVRSEAASKSRLTATYEAAAQTREYRPGGVRFQERVGELGASIHRQLPHEQGGRPGAQFPMPANSLGIMASVGKPSLSVGSIISRRFSTWSASRVADSAFRSMSGGGT